jgi:hypothetical protein
MLLPVVFWTWAVSRTRDGSPSSLSNGLNTITPYLRSAARLSYYRLAVHAKYAVALFEIRAAGARWPGLREILSYTIQPTASPGN